MQKKEQNQKNKYKRGDPREVASKGKQTEGMIWQQARNQHEMSQEKRRKATKCNGILKGIWPVYLQLDLHVTKREGGENS